MVEGGDRTGKANKSVIVWPYPRDQDYAFGEGGGGDGGIHAEGMH